MRKTCVGRKGEHLVKESAIKKKSRKRSLGSIWEVVKSLAGIGAFSHM